MHKAIYVQTISLIWKFLMHTEIFMRGHCGK